MRYGSIYLVVKDFNKSVLFYEKILDMEVSAVNGKCFAMFNCNRLNLCLMNGYFDFENREQIVTKGGNRDVYGNQKKIADSIIYSAGKAKLLNPSITI